MPSEIERSKIKAAITVLEEFAHQPFDNDYVPLEMSSGDVLDVVLPIMRQALQAQIKPGCETCQWCSRGQLFVQRNYATVLRTGWMLPTYCPNCGKVLKGGE